MARRQAPSTDTFTGFAYTATAPQVPIEPATAPRAPAAPAQNRADTAFIGTLSAISCILASRLILLLAVLGGFVLAIRADAIIALPWILIAYCILVVIPLVALDIVTRRK